VGVANPTNDRYITQWNFRYGQLIEYKEKHGHCNVPQLYEPNKKLGTWVHYQRLGMWVGHQRTQYRLLQQGKQSSMTEERIDKLEEIGFVWDVTHLRGDQSRLLT